MPTRSSRPQNTAREGGGGTPKTELKSLSLQELESLVAKLGEPRYRADQLAVWIYPRGATDFGQMTDLSLVLRDRLAAAASICHAIVVKKDRSKLDRTEKLLLEYEDGTRIESVLLRDGQRATGCISTQAGCRFGCSFCASGAMGFVRDLSAAEIVEQIIALSSSLAPERLDNIVFMGMGEPLDNYDATMKAVNIANAPWGLGIGARRITISTAGLVPGIRRLAEESLQINLAISLNAPVQSLRSKLMPIAEKYGLDELISAAKAYSTRTGRRPTLEYVLLRDINDSPEMADKLAEIARKVPCKINLICYNQTREGAYAPPNDKTVENFTARLMARCPTVVRRVSRGSDIGAGCGQLAVAQD